MKKYLAACVFLCLAIVVSCGAALAADTAQTGIRDVTVTDTTVSVTPDGQDDGAGAFPGAEKLTVVYSGSQEGKQYLILALTGDAITEEGPRPTRSSIIYMDQTDENGAPANGASFEVYPSALEVGNTYYIALSSDAETGIHDLTEVASFAVYQVGGDEDDVIYGNLTEGDAIVNASDVVILINHIVNKIELTENQQKAANVVVDFKSSGEPNIDASDVARIINSIVNKVELTPETRS